MTNRGRGRRHDEVLQRLISAQAGVVARRQLTGHGLGWDRVEAHVRAGRWVARTPRVISTTTGPLDLEQRRWLAVLHAGPRSMLGGLSAAHLLGLTGWERQAITVWVDDELAFDPVPGVRFFRTRRPFDVLRRPGPGLPVARLEPAVLLAAAYDLELRAAHGVVAAAVQQRRTTPDRLLEWIDLLRPLRRARSLRALLGDVAAGSHSRSELDLADLCRERGLELPRRQTRRPDEHGRVRWTDAEWDLADGGVLVLEVDGTLHLDRLTWQADQQRRRRMVSRDRIVIGCTAAELRDEPDGLVADLLALGVRRTGASSRSS